MTMTLTLAGAPDPAVYENYGYERAFEEPGRAFQLRAEVEGAKDPVYYVMASTDAPEAGAGGSGARVWTRHPVDGAIDLTRRTVTVTVPRYELGEIRAGRTWTVTAARAVHGYVYGSAFQADTLDMKPTRVVAGDGRCKR